MRVHRSMKDLPAGSLFLLFSVVFSLAFFFGLPSRVGGELVLRSVYSKYMRRVNDDDQRSSTSTKNPAAITFQIRRLFI